MRYDPVSSELFSYRRNAFIRKMAKNSVAIFCSNDHMPRTEDQSFPFRQHSDLFSMTGLDQPDTLLLLYRGASLKDTREIAFITTANPLHTVWNGKRYSKTDAQRISGISTITTHHHWKSITNPLLESAERVYVNTSSLENLNANFISANDRMEIELKKKWPDKQYSSARPLLGKLRMIKHKEEIRLMKRAIEVTGHAFHSILQHMSPGLMEYEVEADMTAMLVRHGCQHAFEPIIASGKSACTLHYVRNDGVLKSGSLVLLDFGAAYAGMAADISRTIPVSGIFSKRQRDLYDAVSTVHDEVINMMQAGITLKQLNKETGKLIDHALIDLHILSKAEIRQQDPANPLRKKYFMHGVSHHLGWDVHDLSDREAPLAPGMVLTCEPGLYIPEEKTGIRLENDIMITSAGPKNLSAQIPIDPDEIETLMQANKKK